GGRRCYATGRGRHGGSSRETGGPLRWARVSGPRPRPDRRSPGATVPVRMTADHPLPNRSPPAYWFGDILWVVHARGEQTQGRYAVVVPWLPEGPGPPRDVHPFEDATCRGHDESD